ncbi:MAG: valine--tRNA ligase [Pedosphaera sp.]|nr:valine--tRNA ligase [Pedosphaera sp.]
MSELSKAYEPQAVEEKWYQFWLDQKCFVADPDRVGPARPAYSIVIPPPNVTGVLTLGHVLNNTIQDILARKARMDGKEVLWLPGTDHAGIATQTVVERTLKKTGEIRHRDDLGRDKFLEKVWQWKEKHGGIIIQQLKKLGASCDWTRERFTMDPAYSKCVQQVFVDLYRKGLIYRGKRMVNWCPASLTALSDEEVEMKEQKGFLYYFRVQVAEQPGTWLTIATTRPETIPGDTAVAVNPKDPRYAALIGKHVLRPLPAELPEAQKRIPIVGDAQVDFEFGTGVLKVTPAHDKADFEIGQRHQLAVVDILNPDGVLNEQAGGDLRGLDRFAGRKVAIEKLRELGVLEKEEPYVNNVGFSERAGVPVEPRLSEQWFLKYPSTGASTAVVADGRMNFFPERWAKVYGHWMGGLQDWCISRQLWWGHRVPVWYHRTDGRLHVGLEAPADPDQWTQDNDVLDTWFSSWLWPFATMGWPEKTETLRKFYPTTDLVTGPDIIFFWVARMIMAGYEFMGEMPFRNVYFTGIIRDKQGRKMSKSLGNSPDPLDLIAKYGADALRFGVMRAAPLGQDILFDEQTVELGRNFCNKLWNACRFRQMQGGTMEDEIEPGLLTSDDKWILLRLDQAIGEVTRAFAEYRFSEATGVLYRFFWSEYCDWYVEASKPALAGRGAEGDDTASAQLAANKRAVIDFVLGNTLRLFHPFLPFITEELWHGLGFSNEMPPERGGTTIMVTAWPRCFTTEERDYFELGDAADQLATARFELVTLGRNLKAQFNLPSSKRVPFILRPAGAVSPAESEVMKCLLNAEALEVVAGQWTPDKGTPMVTNAVGELFLPLAGLVDATAERARLTKELEKTQVEVTKVREKLANPGFVNKVPPAVLADHKQRLVDWEAKENQIRASLANLPV